MPRNCVLLHYLRNIIIIIHNVCFWPVNIGRDFCEVCAFSELEGYIAVLYSTTAQVYH